MQICHVFLFHLLIYDLESEKYVPSFAVSSQETRLACQLQEYSFIQSKINQRKCLEICDLKALKFPLQLQRKVKVIFHI